MTAELAEQLKDFPLYSQDGKQKDATCVCVFEIGLIRWYVLEGQPEGDDFTLFSIAVGMAETEYGYASVKEMEGITVDGSQYGLGMLNISGYRTSCQGFTTNSNEKTLQARVKRSSLQLCRLQLNIMKRRSFRLFLFFCRAHIFLLSFLSYLSI